MDTIYITDLLHKGNLRLVVEVDVETTDTWEGIERPDQKGAVDCNIALEWVMKVRTDEHSYRVGYYFTNMFLACGLPSGLQLTKAGITEINKSLETILAHHEWILKGRVSDTYMEFIIPEELR